MDNKNITLKKGQKVSATLYIGSSKYEAEVTYNYLENLKDTKKSMPFTGSGFSVNIEDVTLMSKAKKEVWEDDITYKVEFEGTLI